MDASESSFQWLLTQKKKVLNSCLNFSTIHVLALFYLGVCEIRSLKQVWCCSPLYATLGYHNSALYIVPEYILRPNVQKSSSGNRGTFSELAIKYAMTSFLSNKKGSIPSFMSKLKAFIIPLFSFIICVRSILRLMLLFYSQFPHRLVLESIMEFEENRAIVCDNGSGSMKVTQRIICDILPYSYDSC